jgi:hypothetical protein
MPLSSVLNTKILNGLSGQASSFSLLPTLYLGLSTTTPNADGTGVTEPPAVAGYYRVLCAANSQSLTIKMSDPSLDTTSGRYITKNTENGGEIAFPEALASWGTITYLVLYGSNLEPIASAYAPLTTPITPTAGQVVIIKAGDFSISIA